MSDTWTFQEIWDRIVARAGEPEVDALGKRLADAVAANQAAVERNQKAARSLSLGADQPQRAWLEAADALSALAKTAEDVARAMGDARVLLERAPPPNKPGEKK